MSRPILFDTSIWVEVIRRSGDPATQEVARQLLTEGRVRLCDPVRLELWNGAGSDHDRQLLTRLEADLPSVETTPETWALARAWASEARRRGVSVPALDLLIAAVAKVHDLELLHRDAHFEAILPAPSQHDTPHPG